MDLIEAVKLNDIQTVKILLDKGFDPSIDNNEAIKWASWKGYLEIVKLLLENKKVDPSANDNSAIKNCLLYTSPSPRDRS